MIIVGGGPVGLALALAASRLHGVDVTVIEKNSAAEINLPEPFDHRVYALSPASLTLLHKVGAELDATRTAPVHSMLVWGDVNNGGDEVGDEDGHNKIEFNGSQPLATIVEHAVVMNALHQQLAAAGQVQIKHGVSPVEIRAIGGNRYELAMSDRSILTTDLLIGADGSRSQIREWAGISTASKDYLSEGVVANFRTEQGHGDCARQWFTGDSVLAFLPLPGNHISIVWSVGEQRSQALPTDPDAFCQAVMKAGQNALGKLTLVSPIARFPLSRIMANSWTQPGLALIGDAAHTVHPLAGQGMNLGFADVRNMVTVLRNRSRFSAIGDLSLLRRYERTGREAAWAVGEITDRLRGLFIDETAVSRWVRNDGLAMLNRLPGAKSLLIDYASR